MTFDKSFIDDILKERTVYISELEAKQINSTI